MQLMNSIGIMSGTSLDGLDIAFVQFWFEKHWKFKIVKSTTIQYNQHFKEKLSNAHTFSGYELIQLNKEYGRFIGQQVNNFISDIDVKIDFLASHGHTVFHQPEKALTLQIGDGYEIAVTTGITTICDFRSLDVALGGQGAPLVPIGDKFLFGEYDYCINIGGFANISFDKYDNRMAYDIGPANIILNKLAKRLGKDFDQNGDFAQSGKLCDDLLAELNHLEYYKIAYPKSLGREWLETHFLPIIEKYSISEYDKLNTICHHIAFQITESVKNNPNGKILITGGGAYNAYLIELIKQKAENEIIVPESQLIEYKEALVFAFLGLLRFQNKVNCLSSVTGATRDSSCGVIYFP